MEELASDPSPAPAGDRAPNALHRLAAELAAARRDLPLVAVSGRVTAVSPIAFRVAGLSTRVSLGDHLRLFGAGEDEPIAEVISIGPQEVVAKSFGSRQTAVINARAQLTRSATLHPDESWKGRVIDALGRPIDGAGPLVPGPEMAAHDMNPPGAMRRQRVLEGLATGVRAIDIFTPLCFGQRIGIFAGSGVGKSTLLGMMASALSFDTVVLALVGERGREVREFLEDVFGPARQRTVSVVATSDESPMMRRLAAKTATGIAEHFRDRGQRVLLIVDSLTRFAHACREVAIAAGEPAVARGYTPSVFAELPRLVERAGPGEEGGGSITAIFAVLVDSDDHNDPIADSVRGLLDGHIVLSRHIAESGRLPAVDVLASVSRLADKAWTADQRGLVRRLRNLIARFEDTRDLRALGGYQKGQDAELDQAVVLVPQVYDALRQLPGDPRSRNAFQDLAVALAQRQQAA